MTVNTSNTPEQPPGASAASVETTGLPAETGEAATRAGRLAASSQVERVKDMQVEKGEHVSSADFLDGRRRRALDSVVAELSRPLRRAIRGS